MLLLSTSSLKGYWIHRIFSIAKKAWFDWIDLYLSKENYDLWDVDYIDNLSKEFWVKVVSITAPSKWINEDNIEKIIKLTQKLDSQLVVFSPPYFKDSNASWFESYLQKTKKTNSFSVAIKNIEPEFLLLVIPKYKKASLADIKKITWDTALDIWSIDNSSWIDIDKAYRILWNSIKNIYLSDKTKDKIWLLPWNWWGGISNLPLESFLMKLKTNWYSWLITIKVAPNELGIWSESFVLENLNNIISYYKKHFKNYK